MLSRFRAIAIGSAVASAGAACAILWRRTRRSSAELTSARAELLTQELLGRAMIDSARASVALLDQTGRIFQVNQNWREFAEANGYAGPGYGVGASYLDLCSRAQRAPFDPQDACTAAQAKRAIEAVLSGASDSYRMLYPCHPPQAERWFEMTVTPMDLGGRRGAVVRHFNVTDQALVQRELLRQSELLQAIGAQLSVTIFQRFLRAGEWDYVYASEGVCETFGCGPGGLRSFQEDRIFSVVFEDDRERVVRSYQEAVASGGGVWRSEFRLRDGKNTIRWMDAVVRLKVEEGREVESLWVLHDVSEQRLTALRVRYAYEYDALTGLFSRAYFETALAEALESYARTGRTCAVVVLDIDGFREVNEVYGMAVGDQLLREVALGIASSVRGNDLVARIDSDKFGVLCEVPSAEAALELTRRLVSELHRTYDAGGHRIAITFSAGIAAPRDGLTKVADLLHDADSAFERARASGGNTARAYAEQMRLDSVERVRLRDALREALERGDQFELHYQPEVEIRTGRIVGCEALLRWRHPTAGPQSPARFIPIAEQSGLIVPIGEWVMFEACRQFAAWRAAGLDPVPIAVNVSAVQFAHSDVLSLISRALATTGAPAGAIDIEITESGLVDCSNRLVEELEQIRLLGVRIALDDFGTGFSSLSYLRRLPLSSLKIDQNFARGAVQNARDAAIVRSIVGLASELGLRTIAEGVETAEQLAFLRATGCDEMQGYYVSRALPAAEFSRFLTAGAAVVAEKILSPLRAAAGD
ncbi:MAG: putative bifunctional diguanylate cyclase/phosphodiesterase [Vulcanimicrobiaceae bacterium]